MWVHGVIHYNVDTEQCVLSALMQDNTLVGTSGLITDHFYDNKHRKIFDAAMDIVDHGNSADIMTVSSALSGNVLASYISTLMLPTVGNFAFHIDKLLELYRKRVIMAVNSDIIEYEDEDSFALRGRIEAHLETFSHSTGMRTVEAKKALKPAIEEIEKRFNSKGACTGIQTKIPLLDEYTDGFQDGELIVIGARPSIGKTAFVLTLINNIAIKQDVPAAFFSCEMAEAQIMMRLLSMVGGVKLRQIKSGLLTEADFSLITVGAERIHDSKLWIDDTPNVELRYIKSQSAYLKRQGARIIFVDYLTLIRHGEARTPRYERVGEVSKQLKQLARELNVPVVVLSQVGRQAEGQMPNLADLRQSGEIEEDSDIIMFMHRDRDGQLTQINVEKNRNGETGPLEMIFNKDYVRFDLPLKKQEVV